VGILARACRDHGAALAHVSTDYVFSGEASQPYREDDPTGPRSAYGRSKLLGERALRDAGLPRWWVLRTSWLFGPGGRNFPRAILTRARQGGPLRVVDDQSGSPSFTRDVAPALLDLFALGAPSGVWHAANEGQCTWHEFAFEIVRRAGLDVAVESMGSSELDRPAPRPAWSVLDCEKLAGLRGRRLPHWTDALDRYLAEDGS
jgi:dTDP-4-dehydrorhamnose reductase